MLEIEVPPAPEGNTREIAKVKVSYLNMATHATETLTSTFSASFSRSPEVIERNEDHRVMVDAVVLIANETNKRATWLRDQGKIEDAKKTLEMNAEYLRDQDSRLKAPSLAREVTRNALESSQLENTDGWFRTRKDMRQAQHSADMQQSDQ